MGTWAAEHIDFIIFLWTIVAVSTALLAWSKGKKFFTWLLIGTFFGVTALLYVLIFMKKEKTTFKVPSKDPAERKLWYYNLKQEYERSKREADLSGENEK